MRGQNNLLPGRIQPEQREYSEQCALFSWVISMRSQYPALFNFTATANGEKREKKYNSATGRYYCPSGQRLKNAGVSDGYPDIVLDWAARGYHGLRIELKASKDPAEFAPNQACWKARLEKAGYFHAVCHGWIAAAIVIADYLGIPTKNLERAA